MLDRQKDNSTLLVRLSIALTGALTCLLVWRLASPWLLNTDGFSPHGYCYLWNSSLLTLHVGSDSFIGLAYVSISITLIYFVYKSWQSLPFKWVFVGFGIFIIACGATHFMEIWTLWNATYWFSGIVKLITAIASVATAVVLPPMIPRVLTLIETAKMSEERKQQLEQANKELEVLYERLADALQQSEQRYDSLSEAMPQIVWTSGPDGTVNYFNHNWYEYTGISQGEIYDRGWQAALHPDDLPLCLEQWRQARRTGDIFTLECRLRQSNSNYRWYLARALPIKDRQGQVSSWVGTATDIDAQKRIEEELRQSEQRKDAFLSMASHELKTPITSIKAFTQILYKMFIKEEKTLAVQYLTKMESQINKLISLIADFLDISKMQSGQITLTQEQFALDSLVKDTIDTVQHTTTTHTIRLTGATNATLTGDRERLGQVLTNLLTNAIKYSPFHQSVEVRLATEREQVTISVHDHGIGIPEEHQVKIFERFYRVYDDKDKNFPGLGIGLYIAAQIVQRHGGSIWVESMEEQGSTFTFSLPLSGRLQDDPVSSIRVP